jgi:hypothetical protein
MKTSALLATVMLCAAMSQAMACDWNKEAANAPETVVACGNSNGCATEDQTAPQPTAKPETVAPTIIAGPCGGSNRATEESDTQQPTAKPESIKERVACPNTGCATEDEPPTAAPMTLACSGSNCNP